MEPLYTTTSYVGILAAPVVLAIVAYILFGKLRTAWREHGKDRILDFKALGLKR